MALRGSEDEVVRKGVCNKKKGFVREYEREVR
jgi:hypothetical protein